MNQAKYDQITNCIAKWVAQDCRPLNIVDEERLQKVIRSASGNEAYVLPIRQMITARISTLYESEKEKLQNLLNTANHVALTTDYWTSVANESFLGVNAHFLTEKWHHHIGVMEDRHFAYLIAQHISGVIDEWLLSTKALIIMVCQSS